MMSYCCYVWIHVRTWRNEISPITIWNQLAEVRPMAAVACWQCFWLASRRLWFNPRVRHFLLLKVAIAHSSHCTQHISTSAYTENCGCCLFLKFINRNFSPHSNVINMIHPRSTIFFIYVCFLLACTFCDVKLRNLITTGTEKIASQDHSILATLSKFSLLKNAAEILSTRVQRESLPAIHGMRVISMAWIIMIHQRSTSASGVNANMFYFMKVSTRGVFMW